MRFICFLVSSGSLIGMMLLLRGKLRNRIPPGILYALWLIPAIRLLFPFTLIPLPVLSEAVWETRTFYENDAVSAADAINTEGHAQTPEIVESAGAAEAAFLPGKGKNFSQEPKAESPPPHQEMGIQSCLLCIWLSGSILCGGYVFFINLRLKQHIKQMKLLPEKRLVPVYIRNDAVSPCLFGFFHPCILLSEQTVRNEELCHQALLHEETHYRQKDHIWTALRIFLCIIYWWEPLVWLGAACARDDAEFACDAKALKGASLSEKKAYGYALLELAQGALKSGTLVQGITPISGQGKNIKRRLEHIVSENTKTRFWPLPVCLLFFLFLCGFCFPAQRANAEEKMQTPGTETVERVNTAGESDTLDEPKLQDPEPVREPGWQDGQTEESQTKEDVSEETEAGIRLHPQEHREGYREPDLRYCASADWPTDLTDEPGEQERIEILARRALRELYDLTGYQIESCFYGYHEIGILAFSRTEDDLAHSRVFYSYNMGEKDGFAMIPSIDIVNARRSWYSDVQQIALPANAESMEKEALAVWFLEHSPLCPEGTVVKTEPVLESNPDCLKLTMADGTFYEIEIDMDILAVDNIYGPYPEDAQH